MVCQQCGAVIPDRSKFCPKCGASVLHDPDPAAAEEALREEQIPVENEPVEHLPDWDEPAPVEDEPEAEPEEALPPRVGHAEGHSKLVSLFFGLGVLLIVAAAVFALILILKQDSGASTRPSGATGYTGQIYTRPPSEGPDVPVSTEYEPGEPDPEVDCEGEYVVTLWVPRDERDQYEQLIRSFNAENTEGITIYPTLVPVEIDEAADKLLADPGAEADILCIDADRLAELVQKGLLSPLPASSALSVRSRTDARSLSMAAVAQKLWAYPLSCGGPVLFYNRSVISESAAGSLDAMLQACLEQERFVSFDLSAGQTLSAFFLASGVDCVSYWTVNDSGEFVALEDDLESEKGVLALRGARKLLRSSQYDGAAFGVNSLSGSVAAIISDASKGARVRELLGENFGVAPLPTFGVDGSAYHLGSYLSGELLVVAERDSYETAIRLVLHKLTAFLTNEAAQRERYESLGLCPTDQAAQAAVRAEDPVADALLTQRTWSVRHGPVPSAWNRAAQQLLKDTAKAEADENETETLMTALRRYTDTTVSLVMTEQTRSAYTVMGTLCQTHWNQDFPMYEIRPGYYVSEVLYLRTGEEFKVRMNGSWDYNYGTDGRDGANCVVETEGWYRVWFDRAEACMGIEQRPQPAEG